MKSDFQLVIRSFRTGSIRRLTISRTSLIVSFISVIAVSLLIVSAGVGFMDRGESAGEIARLRQELQNRDTQLAYFSDRMSQIREELDSARSLNLEVETELGRIEKLKSEGLGGPQNIEDVKNVRKVAYFNSESELLDKMWTEMEEIEQDVTFQQRRSQSLIRFLKSKSALVRAIPSIRPVTGGYISSDFGRREDPFSHSIKMHSGLDIVSPPRTPVAAAAEGIVIQCGWNGDYGRIVTLYHGFGLTTFYAHLNTIAVKSGDWVDQGHIIGSVGSTGRSTSSHLHYEVRIEGRAVNPEYFLPEDES